MAIKVYIHGALGALRHGHQRSLGRVIGTGGLSSAWLKTTPTAALGGKRTSKEGYDRYEQC